MAVYLLVGLLEASCSGHGYSTPPREVGGIEETKHSRRESLFVCSLYPPTSCHCIPPCFWPEFYTTHYTLPCWIHGRRVFFSYYHLSTVFLFLILFRFSLSVFKSC
ncbi:uncharacterized protein B0T23DRAFT_16871 [Neurospora hispaniola]|uniref:Secreted protein n=1 Tax=Neurospora hispaniola TaxID=588809 RepID=A0AAJ0IFF4_9PEZI|nr:hypothetical protein B0T23DRAFT_16871 [Neurospora hispaniola]